MKLRKLAASTGMALAGGLLVAGQAQAGFLSPFEGFSVFGAGAPVCELCDSTVNFAVYETEDNDWTDDAPFNGRNIVELDATGNSIPITTDADLVLLYQVINTDPLDVSNPPLEDFNVTIESGGEDPPLGDPPFPETVDPLQYTSGGYIENTVFDNFQLNGDDPDVPNDWIPGEIFDVQTDDTFGDDPNAIEPSSVLLTSNFIIAHPAVNGGVPYPGALFDFDPAANGAITPDATSSLLFLTVDLDEGVLPDGREWRSELGFVWAETQSLGGFGAPGDVPGVKKVIPEPTTLALLGIGLAGLGVTRRRRKIA